jgi:hypothetical protein
MEQRWDDTGENQSLREKPCPVPIMSITNPTISDCPELEPGSQRKEIDFSYSFTISCDGLCATNRGCALCVMKKAGTICIEVRKPEVRRG